MSPAKRLVGIGVDSVAWDRMKRFLASHSFQFTKRLLAPSEQKAFQKTARPLQFFARSFAAKEAYFKASGGSWMEGETGFRKIEVRMKGRNRFKIGRGFQTEGEFFNVRDGIAARVLIWKKGTP